MAEFNYYYFKKYFDKSKIEEINNFIEKNFDKEENINDGAKHEDGSFKKNARAINIYWGKVKHLLHDLENQLHLINQKHFGFHINNMNDYVYTLLNIYDSKNIGSYDWHRDTSQSVIYDSKLTVLINLSTENYKGGEFLLNTGEPQIIKDFSEPGDVLIFQSHILHKVNPVLSGVRKSLAFWFFGPSFR